MSNSDPSVAFEAMKKRYKKAKPAETTAETFDRTATKAPTSTKSGLETRLGEAPAESFQDTADVGSAYVELSGLQNRLIALGRRYGKFNVQFKDVVGKDKVFKFMEALKIKWYDARQQHFEDKMTSVDPIEAEKKGYEAKADKYANIAAKIRNRGYARHNRGIELVIDAMAEIVTETAQKASEGVAKSKKLQGGVVDHMKYLHEQLIENLCQNNYTGADYAAAVNAVESIMNELGEADKVLEGYEMKINEAREKKDIDEVKRLSVEMDEALQFKYQLLDGQLEADGVASDIKREILDAADGVQTAKCAIAASRVNYEHAKALVDSFAALESKYNHARDMMLEVFRQQGQITTSAKQIIEMKQALQEIAGASQQLMELNTSLVLEGLEQASEFLRTPIYDVQKAMEYEKLTRQRAGKIAEVNLQWAELETRIKSVSESGAGAPTSSTPGLYIPK